MEQDQAHRPPWHIRRTGFPTAWRLAGVRPSGQRPVRIGILDSGADLRHPLLQRLLGPGVNLLTKGEQPQDENGHGTHVAGVIAAACGAWSVGNRAHPIVLYPVKIFDQTGYGKIGDIVKALYWCVDQRMDIVNLSFGTDLKTSQALQRAIQEVDQAGLVLVGAAGNDGRQGAVDFPGRYPEVLAVSASTRSDRLAPFSSVGSEVDLIAPGASVVSLAPDGGLVRMSGTSMAAPHVTAAIALLLGLEPFLTPNAVRAKVKATTEWLPMVTSEAQGAGLLRADRLLRLRPGT